jgi:digeranylgeranylglycerophospholipid reductase
VLKKRKYDIIVIGAGPAGSVCARKLAEKGYDILLCEKKPIVGVPVRCGEATGNRGRLAAFTEINEKYIETDVHGVILYTPELTITYDKNHIGLMIDRALFDQDLAQKAEKSGAELCLKARVSDVLPAKNSHRTLKIVYQGQEEEAHGSLIIASDGAEALCGRWAGLKCRQKPLQTCSTIEFKIKGENKHPNHLSFWTGFIGAENGYIWSFSKKKSGIINLGCGAITPQIGEPDMQQVMKAFKQKYYPDSEILSVHGGAVPVSGNLEESVADRFLLAGDAAHHTNPLTGGGIGSAMHAGAIAAKWVDRAFVSGDFSRKFFRNYETECWNTFGKSHRRQMRIRDFILGLSKADRNKLFSAVKHMAERDFSFLSKAAGYARIYPLMLENMGLVWKILRKT